MHFPKLWDCKIQFQWKLLRQPVLLQWFLKHWEKDCIQLCVVPSLKDKIIWRFLVQSILSANGSLNHRLPLSALHYEWLTYLSWWIIKLIASNSTAFFAFECCTFLDFGGSWALLRIVSRHSVRRPRADGSSGRNRMVKQTPRAIACAYTCSPFVPLDGDVSQFQKRRNSSSISSKPDHFSHSRYIERARY